MKVFWTPHARQRLAEIEAYISGRPPAAGRNIAAQLVRRSLTLGPPPLFGRELAQYPGQNIRELLARPFRLVFRVRGDRVEILTVLHYRQLLPQDLAALAAGPRQPPA